MAVVSRSIEADVPAAFANREWAEYMQRSFYAQTPASSDDYGDGTVKFEPAGADATKVTVEVEYLPDPGADAKVGLDAASERLTKTLQGFRDFIQKRCEETNCWAA